jgi:large subunit ribosomal protein L29
MATELSKLRGMSPQELGEEERALREEIWKLRLQRSTGQLQDPHKVRRRRKALAQILTIRREKQLATADGARRQG